MSRKLLCAILYICALAASAYGQQDADVFDDAAYDSYSKACDLNDAKDFMAAYRFILQADQAVNASLSKKRLEASRLDDSQYRYPYWAVKKSRAEIAYMLGLHSDMEAMKNELSLSLKEKTWREADGAADIRKGLWADLAKIDGSRYYMTEKYAASEAALKSALELGGFHGNEYFICKVHDDLAQLYYKQERYDEALAHLDTILASPPYQNESRNKETGQNIRTVQAQRAICLARLGRFDEALLVMEPIVQHFRKGNDKRAYAEALRKQAKMLMLQYDQTGRYSPEALTCYQQYLALSRDYIDSHFVQMSESQREQYWMAEQPFVTDCFRLEDKAPGLLYDVALYSKAVLLQMGRDFKDGMTLAEKRNALASIRVKWQDVRDKLPTDGCAIEFVVYEKQCKNHLGALVLNKRSASPKFVGLGEVTSISDYPLAGRLSVKDVFADTQSQDKINALYSDSTLCRLIWNDGLVSAVGDCKKVYFSPDGILHQMAIEYMAPPSLEGKQLYRLTTTRLITRPKRKIQADKMLACGGVEYQLSEEDREKGNDELAYSLLAPMNLTVAPLPNSAVEIDSISSIRKSHPADMVLRADSLTESALTRLMGKYHIAHLSTHGLFAEVDKMGTDIRPPSTDTQLSKSCLFLSGSEKNLRQSHFDASQHDGILSARELAKMDLANVDLAVLSACMSGLGYVTPDGVYGLQRGLKTAGVNAVISTLWSVDDEASCFFIIQLYRNLEAGMALHEAFRTAREALKNHEKTYGPSAPAAEDAGQPYVRRRRTAVPEFSKPYFYNAFILIDGL